MRFSECNFHFWEHENPYTATSDVYGWRFSNDVCFLDKRMFTKRAGCGRSILRCKIFSFVECAAVNAPELEGTMLESTVEEKIRKR